MFDIYYENDPSFLNYVNVINRFYDVIFPSKGILYFFYLVIDPLIRKSIVHYATCKCNKALQYKEDAHPSDNFLCSSLNMELVCAILQGIQQSAMKDKAS